MKQLSKTLMVMILLVITSSLLIGGTATASTETNWSYDSDTKTVTLHGEGSFPYYSNTLFGDITKEIEHVKMDETLLGSETDFFWKNTEDNLPALKTAEGNLGNGFHWIADYAENTLLISGTGALTLPNGPAYLFPDMETCILDDNITSINTNGRYIRFSNLRLGAGVNIDAMFSSGNLPKLSVLNSYSVSSDNPYYAVYDGVLYSKDYARLISCPSNKTTISFHPDVSTIQSYSFYSSCLVYGENNYQTGFADSKNTVVIPWGVKTIQKDAFQFDAFQSVAFVLPDTLTELAIDPYSFYLYSKNNQAADTQSFSSTYHYKEVDSVAAYYGITPNAFKTFGSKTYYFDADCKMVTGTQTIDGKTYTFDENGILQGNSPTDTPSDTDTSSDTNTPSDSGTSSDSEGEKGTIYDTMSSKPVSATIRFSDLDGKTYCYADGQLAIKRWISVNGNWYLTGDDGTLNKSKWVYTGFKWENYWYWFGGSGKMMSNGWLKLNGKWYYFRSGGQMASGWIKDGGKWYYLTSSGAMATGWIKDGGKWYYLTGSGAMAANKWVKSGKYWYYLGSSGAMLTNTTTPDGYRVDSEGRWV